MYEDIIKVLIIWPIPLAVELGICAVFLWIGRDKPQKPSS